MLDRDFYFDTLRESLFPAGYSQQQVDGQNFILDAWEKYCSDHDLRWLAYFLATTYHETNQEMWPIAEYGKGQGYEYGKPDKTTGETYYGRGFVQLTWADNYERADDELGLEGKQSCYWHADNALDPTIAARVGYAGMVQAWFRPPNQLDKFFNSTCDDAYGAREIINGDKTKVPSWSGGVSIGKLIAGYHDAFCDALKQTTARRRFTINIVIESDSPIDVRVGERDV